MDKESRLLTHEEILPHWREEVRKGMGDWIDINSLLQAQDAKSVKAIVGWMEAHECTPEDHDVTYEGIDKIQKHHPDCQLCFWEALKLGV